MGITLLKNFSHKKHHSIKSELITSIAIIFVVAIAFKFKMKSTISILLFIGAIMFIIGLENALVKACSDCCDLDKIAPNCEPKCVEGSCIDKMRCINPDGETCWQGEE